MFFKDIIGQQEVKRKLILEVNEGRVPHAQLLCGPQGSGKLLLAIAYARYLNCSAPGPDDACGHCPCCVKFGKLVHPDLHFAFPVVRKKAAREVVCDDYIAEWRNILLHTPYFSLNHWLAEMGAENQQAQIYVRESDEILRKLSLKSSQGGYKTMIIWLPEKMNQECSNKLLKLLEEPPAQTVFLLVSENPESILPTILSRTQRLNIPQIDQSSVTRVLHEKFGLSPEDARSVAHLSNGNFLKAMEAIHLSEESKLFHELFVSLMRLCYQRKIKEMKAWSEQVAAMGRERQKNFLDYCQRMVRENFVYNFRQSELVYMNRDEINFSARFAPFINEKNVMGIMKELSQAQIHVEQNVNPKMIFFDFSLQMIVLLKTNN